MRDTVRGPQHAAADEAPRLALARDLQAWLESAPARPAIKPGHRIKLRWPPHPISYAYHVLATDWRGSAVLEAHGRRLPVLVARTPSGVFGRCEPIWLEAKGDDEAHMLASMRREAEPYFRKLAEIGAVLGVGVFSGSMAELAPLELLKLLFAESRDIADDAQIEIEKRGGKLFTPGLVAVLRDARHRCRRSAQWCALDLFEELPSFCLDAAEERAAVAAMRDLIWNAEDDYARTVFKAGVVVGGHLSETYGGPVLLECLAAPSPIGRRSAIHGLFHVAEWVPALREEIVDKLRERAAVEPERKLAAFARDIADDVEEENLDHVPEPVFRGE